MIRTSVLLTLTQYRLSQMSLISFKIGNLICECHTIKDEISIFSSPFSHMRLVGSVLFWLNDDHFT